MTKMLDQAILREFTGSETWYRHALVRQVLFTDGAKYVADVAGAYWLLDHIALAQRYEAAVKAESFQVWRLKVEANCSATLTCEDGNKQVVYKFTLEFTDFPHEGITLWYANEVIHLPSEY